MNFLLATMLVCGQLINAASVEIIGSIRDKIKTTPDEIKFNIKRGPSLNQQFIEFMNRGVPNCCGEFSLLNAELMLKGIDVRKDMFERLHDLKEGLREDEIQLRINKIPAERNEICLIQNWRGLLCKEAREDAEIEKLEKFKQHFDRGKSVVLILNSAADVSDIGASKNHWYAIKLSKANSDSYLIDVEVRDSLNNPNRLNNPEINLLVSLFGNSDSVEEVLDFYARTGAGQKNRSVSPIPINLSQSDDGTEIKVDEVQENRGQSKVASKKRSAWFYPGVAAAVATVSYVIYKWFKSK